jgi:OOP family OmpA-OmpF porin
MPRLIGSVFITLFIAGAAFSSEIRHMDYSYPYEFAESAIEKAFIVCDDCPTRKSLEPAPKGTSTIISIKLSQPAPFKSEPSKVEQQEKGLNNKGKRALTDTSLIVYFDLNSAALRPEEKEKLKTVSFLFKGPITVTGYTCDIGSDEYNRRLSLQRAEAVAEYLRRLGVAPRAITGKGKCCPVSDTKELNRRVEIKEAR